MSILISKLLSSIVFNELEKCSDLQYAPVTSTIMSSLTMGIDLEEKKKEKEKKHIFLDKKN